MPLSHVALATCVLVVEVVYWPSERKKIEIVARAAMNMARGLKRMFCNVGILFAVPVVWDYSIAALTCCLQSLKVKDASTWGMTLATIQGTA